MYFDWSATPRSFTAAMAYSQSLNKNTKWSSITGQLRGWDQVQQSTRLPPDLSPQLQPVWIIFPGPPANIVQQYFKVVIDCYSVWSKINKKGKEISIWHGTEHLLFLSSQLVATPHWLPVSTCPYSALLSPLSSLKERKNFYNMRRYIIATLCWILYITNFVFIFDTSYSCAGWLGSQARNHNS